MRLAVSINKRLRRFCFKYLRTEVMAGKIRPFSIDSDGIWMKTGLGFSLFSNLKNKMLKLDINPIWEEDETHFLLKLIKKDDNFIDVGANIGYFSLLAGYTCKANVYAFEPVPDTYKMLTMNIQYNDTKEWIHPFNIALGDKEGKVCFTSNLGPKNHVQYETSNTDNNGQNVEVNVTTLDKFIEKSLKLTHIDFIKVDVEGYEYRFLTGASETLKTFKPIVMIEVSPKRLSQFGTQPQAIFQFFENMGYNYAYFENNRITQGTIPEQDIMKAINFIFYPPCRKII